VPANLKGDYTVELTYRTEPFPITLKPSALTIK